MTGSFGGVDMVERGGGFERAKTYNSAVWGKLSGIIQRPTFPDFYKTKKNHNLLTPSIPNSKL